MLVREINLDEFNKFVTNHTLGTFYQSVNYALLKGIDGFDYELIGYFDDGNNIKAASLILFKRITLTLKYGYAPRGFIIDYTNKPLLERFTKDLIEYYKKRRIAFIKLNPELAIAKVSNSKKTKTPNAVVQNYLEELGYLKLKDNLYFESALPRFNAIIDLKNYQTTTNLKNTRNKINRSKSKGLKLIKGSREDLDLFLEFVKRKKYEDLDKIKDLYNIFYKDDMVDLFLVSIDKNDYLKCSKNNYEKELANNNKLNDQLNDTSNKKLINKKMDSDRVLTSYKHDIESSTEISKNEKEIYIAGALIIKYKNRITILYSGYDKNYKQFNPNYYLHHEIFEYYKNNFDYAIINSVTGDFSKESPYAKLNDFYLGFNPDIYENIGEYDLPISEEKYARLILTGRLAKFFDKENQKTLNHKNRQ